MSDDLFDVSDYELDPMTVLLMQRYRDGNDIMMNNLGAGDGLAGQLVELVHGLTDYTKGVVIIDLLTLSDILSQVITQKNMPPDPDEE